MSSRNQNLAELLARGTRNAAEAGPMVTPQQVEESASVAPPTAKAPRKAPKKKAPAKRVESMTTGDDPAAAPAQKAPASSTDEGRMVRAATLVPTELHREISARRDGTFGQLITWSCLDFPEQIIADILESLRSDSGVSRAPRALRSATPKNVTRQIAPTFLPAENTAVLELLERVRQEAADADVDPARIKKITRTVLHVVALRRWAQEHPPTDD